MPTTLYQTLMGPAFKNLAPEIQRFHSTVGTRQFQGHYTLRSGHGWLARLLGRVMRLPMGNEKGSSRALVFELIATPHGEHWVRRFAHRTTRSTLVAGPGVLREHMGPLTFSYRLSVEGTSLRMHLAGLHVLGLPCPAALLPNVWALESGKDGKLWFDVGGGWGPNGLVAAYAGWLTLLSSQADLPLEEAA